MLYQEWDPILGEPIEGPYKNKNKEFFIVKKSEEEISKLCIDEQFNEI